MSENRREWYLEEPQPSFVLSLSLSRKTQLKTAAEHSAGAPEVLAEEKREKEMATALDGRVASLPRARE